MTAVPDFDLDAVDSFRYLDWTLADATGRVTLRYSLDAGTSRRTFCEVVDLPGDIGALTPPRRAALAACLRLLWLTAGVSYYKAAAPLKVILDGPPLTVAERAWCQALYTHGLAEFGYRNALDLTDRPHWPPPSPTAGPSAATGLGLRDVALLPVGGGKDSAVSLELLRSAGKEVISFSVNENPAIMRMVAAAGLPHLTAARMLDPALGGLNQAGARNGHVPVTAIVSLIALATALTTGCNTVVMSNERSASVANLTWNGQPVNHQWSKGFAAERALADLVAAQVSPELGYFSLLRPLSELSILARFATLTQYHRVFTSCNTAFRLDEARRSPGWCANCPKCRFVFLGLAPWLGPAEVTAIVGRTLLDDPAQADGFLALLGIGADKPFECVGEIEESRAAVVAAADSPAWSGARLLPILREKVAAAGPVPTMASLLVPSSEHAIPAAFVGVLGALG